MKRAQEEKGGRTAGKGRGGRKRRERRVGGSGEVSNSFPFIFIDVLYLDIYIMYFFMFGIMFMIKQMKEDRYSSQNLFFVVTVLTTFIG